MGFFYSQLIKKLPEPTGSFSGKTVIITGSNTGLGKEAARHFARLGVGRLILAVRSSEKGEAAKKDIVTTTKCSSNVISVWNLDMASYASVQAFAARVEAELDRVDIFLANAGVNSPKYALAEDNEATITINVVSTFLLVALVMPKLKATAEAFHTTPTLSITTSDTHAFAQFPQRTAPDGQIFNTINDKATAEKNWLQHYPLSKLLEVLGTRAIAERYPAAELHVTVNCVNPGLCASDLVKDLKGPVVAVMKAASTVLARTTEVGSRTLFHAGTQGAESHGRYMSDCEITNPSKFVLSKEGKVAQDRVWDELVAKLGATKPGLMSNFSAE